MSSRFYKKIKKFLRCERLGNKANLFFDVKIEFRFYKIEWKRAENRHLKGYKVLSADAENRLAVTSKLYTCNM